jgi:hypothetical protein
MLVSYFAYSTAVTFTGLQGELFSSNALLQQFFRKTTVTFALQLRKRHSLWNVMLGSLVNGLLL